MSKIKEKALLRFNELGGESWLASCHRDYIEGQPLREVAERCGVTRTYLQDKFKMYGFSSEKDYITLGESQIACVIKNYEKGMPVTEISKVTGVAYKTCLSLLKKKGYDTARCKRRRNLFNGDKDFFKRLDKESPCYFFGLLMSDGNIRDNGDVTLSLNTKDANILHQFKTQLKINSNVNSLLVTDKRSGTVSDRSYISFTDEEISKDLNCLGLVPRKSCKEQVPDQLSNNRHFWRGVIDGDGSISDPERHYPLVWLCGSKSLCESFKKYCSLFCDTSTNAIYNTKNDLYVFKVTGDKAISMMEILYLDSEFYLERKLLRSLGHLVKDIGGK